MHLRYDTTAAKRTVSVTLNSDLYAKAKEVGLNVSSVAEAALIQELDERLKQKIRAEIQQDLEVYNAYIAEHGSFAETMQEFQQGLSDDEAV